jgi:hypothetical protein
MENGEQVCYIGVKRKRSTSISCPMACTGSVPTNTASFRRTAGGVKATTMVLRQGNTVTLLVMVYWNGKLKTSYEYKIYAGTR